MIVQQELDIEGTPSVLRQRCQKKIIGAREELAHLCKNFRKKHGRRMALPTREMYLIHLEKDVAASTATSTPRHNGEFFSLAEHFVRASTMQLAPGFFPPLLYGLAAVLVIGVGLGAMLSSFIGSNVRQHSRRYPLAISRAPPTQNM